MIELPHDDGIALAQLIEHALQLGPVPAPTGCGFLETLSVTTIRAERAADRFPAPIPITRGRIVWLKEDLDRYLDEKAGRAVYSNNGREWMEA
ncbi:MAG: hypothetical protein JOY71_25880 [Acetobacteraceae bacterium]|nr:hypothetical protein [Acetobacteraceae bacterium]